MSKIMISFKGTDELKEKLRVEAFNKHLTISALIRNILESNLTENNGDNRINK